MMKNSYENLSMMLIQADCTHTYAFFFFSSIKWFEFWNNKIREHKKSGCEKDERKQARKFSYVFSTHQCADENFLIHCNDWITMIFILMERGKKEKMKKKIQFSIALIAHEIFMQARNPPSFIHSTYSRACAHFR